MTYSVSADAPALRALSIGEILDAAFTLYRRHFVPLATVALVCSVVPFLIDAYLEAMGGTWANAPLKLANMLLSVVLNAVATAASVFLISDSYLGHTPTARDAFRRAEPLVGRIILCTILIGLCVMFGLVLLVVPGIMLALGFLVAIPALVLEPQLTPSTALSRSWGLTQGSKWRMLGLFVTAVILIIIPIAATAGLVAMVDGPPWLIAVIGGFAQIFLSPFFYCVVTIAYYDLRVRKEGFDLELLAASLRPA